MLDLSVALHSCRYRTVLAAADGTPRRVGVLYASDALPLDPPENARDARSWLNGLLGRGNSDSTPIDVALCIDSPETDPFTAWFAKASSTSRRVRPAEAALGAYVASVDRVAERVVVVAAAEESTEVVCFRISPERGVLGITDRQQIASVQVGTRAIVDRLLSELRQFMSEPVDCIADPNARQAAMEYLAMLGTAATNQQVMWSGHLSSRLFQPFSVTPQQVQRWDECSQIWSAAIASVRRANTLPNDVVVAGPGAVCPWWQELRTSPRCWVSAKPGDDFARGAAMLAFTGDTEADDPRNRVPESVDNDERPIDASAEAARARSRRLPFLAAPDTDMSEETST